LELLAVFTPLLTFVIAGLFGKQIGDKGAQFITCSGVIIAALASIYLFYSVILGSDPRIITIANWISSGDFNVHWSLRVDQLTVVMMCVVNIVSACVHVYSVGYMSHDPCKGRFMAYLSLFTFAMLMLISADNLLQLFFGWEGVGLASYLLIGFWNQKHSANAAAVKAFIVNRVGDFGLALAIMAIFVVFGTVEFTGIFEHVADHSNEMFVFLGYELHAITVICLLLFMGAMGKSAQLGLHTWLPDAMEGPTPVSALIHAATMVTAGIFLVARFSPLYEYSPVALQVVCVVGALTAFVAATIALTQFDIKRVIAYSTMSQLGYMFFALGVSAYSAAIFHLMTHAFFKALLFLGAGSVIHAMSDEQDMRKMGGIYKLIPYTYSFMWIGSLALAGMPFFAGYYSKDMILESVFADNTSVGMFAFWMGLIAAFMTAFYTWRMLLMTFHGKQRSEEKVIAHIHESPKIMLMPLAVLAVGAITAGMVFYGGFVGSAHHHDSTEYHQVSEATHDISKDNNDTHEKAHDVNEDEHEYASDYHAKDRISWDKESFWGDSIFVLKENDTVEAAHNVPYWVKKSPIVAGLLGILLAYIIYMYREGTAAKLSSMFRPLYLLSFRKWYFDEIYDVLIVKNSFRIGNIFWRTGDKAIIDGYGPDGLSALTVDISKRFSRMQNGYIYHYAFVMIVGMICIVSWFIFKSALEGQ
jgi:NADH-quinone oxidoreductase subunit L